MRPLTDVCPKPLLTVAGKPLIVWHLERLARAGFSEVVINHAHLGEQIEGLLGDGAAWGLRIAWSAEPPGALETAGGIAQALPLLGDQPFLVVNGDIHCDWDRAHARELLADDEDAHLVLVPNPPQHPAGDFCFDGAKVRPGGTAGLPRYTFAGIGVYRPAFFSTVARGSRAALAPLLHAAIGAGRVGGEVHDGEWTDVGTPQRLAELDAELRGRGC